jgi:hypothetical protein
LPEKTEEERNFLTIFLGGKRMKKVSVILFVLVLCVLPASVFASVTLGPNVTGLEKSFAIKSGTVAGLAFDPSYTVNGEYDRIYFLNRVTTTTTRGLYSASISGETYSSRLALTTQDEPYGTAVDNSGNVYVTYSGTSAIYKVAGASSGSPTETRMLGNYGWATSGSPSDDDPVSISMVPTGFGSGYEEGADLLLFDNGIDWNEREGISVIDKTSLSTAQVYTTIWNDGDPVGGNNNDIRGVASEYDGYAYFMRMDILTADSGSNGVLPYFNRMKGDGVVQNIFLNGLNGTMASNLDDSITVNPIDGSIWFVTYGDYSGSGDANDRAIYRVDIENASLIEGSTVDYLVNATLEILILKDEVDTNMNVGVNDLAISPDGKYLAVANPSGTDRLYIYNIVPEPATLVMLTATGLVYLFKRRR